MAKNRRRLILTSSEDSLLRNLYVEIDVPIDKLYLYPEKLHFLVAIWNLMTGRNESECDIIHYMMTLRKDGKWEKIGRKRREPEESLEILALSDQELQVLDVVYMDFQIASDRFVTDHDLASKIHKEFAKRTGRIIPPMILASLMIKRRKLDKLATLRPVEDLSFNDMDELGNANGI